MVNLQPDDVFPVCRAVIGPDLWERLFGGLSHVPGPDEFRALLSRQGGPALPEFLPDLAVLEFHLKTLQHAEIDGTVDAMTINPGLRLLPLSWRGLADFVMMKGEGEVPVRGEELVLLWKNAATGEARMRPASDRDLLALKIVAESLDPADVGRAEGLPPRIIDRVIDDAVSAGILLAPPPLIRRDPQILAPGHPVDDALLCTDVFTLQWHITQACDLRCRHCYDRSDRQKPTLEQAIGVLDDLRLFARKKSVTGAVSFTGGNPFLHPRFYDIYRAAADRGFLTAILGNPSTRRQMEKLIAIQRPSFYQVSLEGLPEHNDYMRGKGHFARMEVFLALLRDLGVRSRVMLTLTRDNMNEIIPLAEMLRGKADSFLFNRLSMVGEGANLQLPDPEEYRAFLDEFVMAAQENPVIEFKDNLINILRNNDDLELFGGCTGYGCGAAFNFVAVLADGEVHACRKLPSLIGNIYEQSLLAIFDSPEARRYRDGCAACSGCTVRAACGGCLAVSYSYGLNIFEERDPFCWMDIRTAKK
ncbi:MAG TPA: thio(seleno)oxazole modification radical SAM maturase SbtM [Dissulfurispiraceae bacterium]|nr:thio(seleno)oxazole modification radical SAM maturase SbtM [Dissulfurispiraceae bacterium]